MTAEGCATRTARLSDRLTVTITASRIGVTAEWHPTAPGTLTGAELRRYREVRDAAVNEVAARLGTRAVVIEA